MELLSDEKKARTMKVVGRIALAVTIAFAGYTAYLIKDTTPVYIKSIREFKYALNHLDPNALSMKENPFRNDPYLEFKFVYHDVDGDGDYESVLSKENLDGTPVVIQIRKDLEGKTQLAGLSKTAVDPFHHPSNPSGIRVDYFDIDGDKSLESITYIGVDAKNFQRMKIELIGDKYVLTDF